jgi:hypothetical protein
MPFKATYLNKKLITLPRIKISDSMSEAMLKNPKARVPRSQYIAQTSTRVAPLAQDEVAALVCCHSSEKEVADKFAKDLVDSGLASALVHAGGGASDAPKARCLIVLVSKNTRRDDSGLIDLASKYVSLSLSFFLFFFFFFYSHDFKC